MDARSAFANRDGELSKAAHEHQEEHAPAGALVKSLVFGGLDGIITTFAIVAAVAGAGLPTRVVCLMGVANLVADGISMGLGDYLSEVAEERFLRHEYEREKWEMKNYPKGEIQEMINIYIKKGFTPEDAKIVMTTIAKYPSVFVDLMCVDELGFIPPDGQNPAWLKGLVTMLAFDIFGAIPLFIYFVVDADEALLFRVSALATAATMFCLGVTKANLTHQPALRSGFTMVAQGSAAAIAAYAIGFYLEHALLGASSSLLAGACPNPH